MRLQLLRGIRLRHLSALAGLALSCFAAISLAAQTRSPDPILVQSSRTDVLLSAANLRVAHLDDRRMAMLVHGCRRAIRVEEADSATIVGVGATVAWSTPAAAHPTVATLVILPTEGTPVNCRDAQTQTSIAAARGVRITYDTMYVADRDLRRAVLRHGDRVLDPIETRRDVITRLNPFGVRSPGAGMLRVAFNLDQLGPDSSGTMDDLVLEVWNESDEAPDRIPIPWRAVRQLWESFYATRADEALDRAPYSAEPVRLPAAADAALRSAHDRYATGDAAAATPTALSRLRSDSLTKPDARLARLQAAFTLAALGDSLAARVLLGGVIDRSPCLTLDSTAPEYARTLVDGIRRPAARCTSNNLAYTAVRGALLPGFGRPVSPARRLGNLVLVGVIGGSAAVATTSATNSRSTYGKYVARVVQSGPDASNRTAAELYSSAESLRSLSKNAWITAGALWGASIIEGVWQEHRHSRAIRAVSAIGRGTPIGGRGENGSGLTLFGLSGATDGRAGLTVTFTW